MKAIVIERLEPDDCTFVSEINSDLTRGNGIPVAALHGGLHRVGCGARDELHGDLCDEFALAAVIGLDISAPEEEFEGDSE